MFWSYIVGMLTNLECLPLDRIYQMLRMFAMQVMIVIGIAMSILMMLQLVIMMVVMMTRIEMIIMMTMIIMLYILNEDALFQGPSAVECDMAELRAFLDNKVRQHKLAFSCGQYRLPK